MRVAWNKGLTKEDPRIKKLHEKGVETRLKNGSYKANSGTFEKGQSRAHYPKGRKNKKLSETRKKMFQSGSLDQSNNKNPYWKGEMVGRSALHEWISKNKPKPEFCVRCNNNNKTELSSNDHTYTRNIDDWEWLCRSCHRKKDNSYKNFKR